MGSVEKLAVPSPLITRLIEWVEKDPNRLAIADENQLLTFSQLLNRVQILASVLNRNFSQDRGKIILPILVDRSVDSVVAILSSLYAGIGFCPLDSELPEERISQLLARLENAKFILAAPTFSESKTFPGAKVISTFERDTPLLSPNDVTEEDIAVIIFTSGSTGIPKGVFFNWGAYATKVFDARDYEEDQLSQLRISVTQPLYFSGGLARHLGVCTGTSIYILDPTKLTQIELLQRARDLKITNFTAPPSIIRSIGLIPKSVEVVLPSVRLIETGSEGIRYEDLALVKRFFNSEVEVHHGLGATEGSSKIRSLFTLHDAPERGQVPVGVATRPSAFSLLPPRDESSEVMEILYGARLATGYFNDLKLTKERFIFDDSGKRWWRSGDLVFEDKDGVFWHRGRIDDLVKVRGKLASPSEATNLLASISGVQSAIVLPHEISGATRLVAHLVLAPESKLSARKVRKILATSLPSHLNPAILTLHAFLPLTSRGKIARTTLQNQRVVPWRDEVSINPQTAVEFSIHNEALFVLDLDELSITDDLWEYGMDSLSAIELISRLERTATRKLGIDDLLRNRTVEQIGHLLEGSFLPHFENLLLNESGKRKLLFAVPGRGGHASHYVHLARALGSDQPILVFPDIAIGGVNLSLESEASRIAIAILNTQTEGIIPLVGYSGGGVLALEVARILASHGKQIKLLLLDTGMRSDNIAMDPNSLSIAFIERDSNFLLRPFVILQKRFGTILKLLRTYGSERGKKLIFQTIMRIYIAPKYRAFEFWISRGKYPTGITRYEFLASKKSRFRKGYVAEPLDCFGVYFRANNNSSVSSWQRLIPQLKVIEVEGDHRTMLQPPYVLGLATEIERELTGI